MERLEDAADRGNVVVAFAFEPSAVVTIIFTSGARLFTLVGRQCFYKLLESWACGHQQLVGVSCDGEGVVLIERNEKRHTEAQIGRYELGSVASVVRNLRTDVADVETPTQL